MNPTLKYCIENPWGFLVFTVGCWILLNGIKKQIPEIGRLICDLADKLLGEFNKPKKDKIMPERINAGVIIGLFIMAILTGMCELMPSAIRNSLGIDTGNQNAGTVFRACLLYLVIVSIGSPTWLYLMEREKRLRKMSDNALK